MVSLVFNVKVFIHENNFLVIHTTNYDTLHTLHTSYMYTCVLCSGKSHYIQIAGLNQVSEQ